MKKILYMFDDIAVLFIDDYTTYLHNDNFVK